MEQGHTIRGGAHFLFRLGADKILRVPLKKKNSLEKKIDSLLREKYYPRLNIGKHLLLPIMFPPHTLIKENSSIQDRLLAQGLRWRQQQYEVYPYIQFELQLKPKSPLQEPYQARVLAEEGIDVATFKQRYCNADQAQRLKVYKVKLSKKQSTLSVDPLLFFRQPSSFHPAFQGCQAAVADILRLQRLYLYPTTCVQNLSDQLQKGIKQQQVQAVLQRIFLFQDTPKVELVSDYEQKRGLEAAIRFLISFTWRDISLIVQGKKYWVIDYGLKPLSKIKEIPKKDRGYLKLWVQCHM